MATGGRGNYQELSNFSPELYDNHHDSNSGAGDTPNLHQAGSSQPVGTRDPLISPPLTYGLSPDLHNDPGASGAHLNIPYSVPPGSDIPKTQQPYNNLRDSSFREAFSPQEYKGPGNGVYLSEQRTFYDGQSLDQFKQSNANLACRPSSQRWSQGVQKADLLS
jgi:hypothetical protein